MKRARLIALGACGALLLAGFGDMLGAAPASATVIKNYTYIPPPQRYYFLWEYDTQGPQLEPFEPYAWEVEPIWSGGELPALPYILHGVALGEESCHSSGLEPGVVETEPLVYKLGWLNHEKGEVGLAEEPGKGTLLAKFECGEGTTVELRGGMIGRLSPTDEPIGEGGELFDDVAVNEETKQAVYRHLEGDEPLVLEMQVNEGGFREVGIEDLGIFSPTDGTLEVKTSGSQPQFETDT